SSRSRFEVGEGTRTDVAQSEASLQVALADLASARAQAASSEALYRQIVGEDPGSLQMPDALRSLMPGGIDAAYSVAFAEHPAIEAREHLVDAAAFTVKVEEGELLPSLSATAGVRVEGSNNYGRSTDGQT